MSEALALIWDILHFAGYTLIAIGLLTWLGNALCKKLLDSTGLTKARDELWAAALVRHRHRTRLISEAG